MEEAKTRSPHFLSQLEAQAPADGRLVTTRSWHDRAINVALVALMIMVLLAPLMTYNELPLTGEGSAARQVGYIVILGLAIYGARPLVIGRRLIAMPLPVLLALGWCWLSISWAIEPDIGARRLLLTSVVVWTTFLTVQQAGYRTTLDIVRVILVIALLTNYAVVFIDPFTGVHMMKESAVGSALAGNWRGFLVHKNFAGAACAMTILFFLFDARKLLPAARIGVILLAAYFLYRTQSKTSAGMTIFALLAGWSFQFYSRRFRAYAIPAIAMVASVGWMVLSAYKDVLVFNYLAPSAFTGRGYIWNMLLRYCADHPFTGAGFGSFWDIGAYSPVYQYGSGVLTLYTVGHNGYLDLLVSIGLPGLFLAIFALVIWPLWKILADASVEADSGALIAAMLIFCIGHNVTESGLFARDALVGFFQLLAVAFAMQLGGRVARRSRKSAAGDDLMRAVLHRKTEVPPSSVA